MSSLTAVKAAIDLLDWKSADYAKIKEVVDALLDSIDMDLEEVAFDESSSTEQLYGKLRKLLDEEDLKLLEEENEAEEDDEDSDDIDDDSDDDNGNGAEDDVEYEDEEVSDESTPPTV